MTLIVEPDTASATDAVSARRRHEAGLA